jgi:hypothetical protein
MRTLGGAATGEGLQGTYLNASLEVVAVVHQRSDDIHVPRSGCTVQGGLASLQPPPPLESMGHMERGTVPGRR